MTMPFPGPLEARLGSTPRRRYLRPPEPRHFPIEQEMPETPRHLELRTALYRLVKHAFGTAAHVGSEQFIYWDPTDPCQTCAPDLFVRLGSPQTEADCWKVWEAGAPQLAVEIMSASDRDEGPWEQKLGRYQRLGVRELVCFDGENAERPLRIWDQIEGDLVERDPQTEDAHRCDTLDAHWWVRERPQGGLELRLSHDAKGERPYLLPEEEAQEQARRAEQRATEAERELQREAQARRSAEERILWLEAELRTERARGPRGTR